MGKVSYDIREVEREGFSFGLDVTKEHILTCIDSAKGYDISARQIAAQVDIKTATGVYKIRAIINICFWLAAKGHILYGVNHGYRSIYYDRTAGEYYSNELLECARETFK